MNTKEKKNNPGDGNYPALQMKPPTESVTRSKGGMQPQTQKIPRTVALYNQKCQMHLQTTMHTNGAFHLNFCFHLVIVNSMQNKTRRHYYPSHDTQSSNSILAGETVEAVEIDFSSTNCNGPSSNTITKVSASQKDKHHFMVPVEHKY